MNYFQRETVEFQPVTVTVDGVKTTTGVTFSVTPDGLRPSIFSAPVTLNDEIGVMVQNFAVGAWRVWAKVTGVAETPVIDCGYFMVV